MENQTNNLRKRHVWISTCANAQSSPKETQYERDSCTSDLMHKTRSCAHTLHKDRVRGVRDGTGKVRWEKLFKGWTTLNDIWRGAVGQKMGRKTTRETHTRAS
jgi:hypothetical protein